MSPFTQSDTFSHVAAVMDDLVPGKRFLLAARPNVESLARSQGHNIDTELVPYPLSLVLGMQRAHLAAQRLPTHDIDLSESLSIQYQLTWNRVIATVSGPLAASYRLRTLPTSAPFFRMTEPRYQSYYFAHQVRVQGRAIEGYWVSRDLHPRTGDTLLVIQPVAIDPGTRARQRGASLSFFSVPILRTWEASVESAARENAVAFGDDAAAAFQAALQYKHRANAWEPIVALVFDALTGAAGAAYERASTQASFSQAGIRHLTLALERGEVAARVV